MESEALTSRIELWKNFSARIKNLLRSPCLNGPIFWEGDSKVAMRPAPWDFQLLQGSQIMQKAFLYKNMVE